MSRTVDERVVEMQFNNQDFEKNVKKSMSTLDKLKKALKLDKAAEGLEELEKVGEKFDMSSVGKSVDQIASQFNLLGRITLKIKDDIASYVSGIIENFARIPKEMTFDQISAGWTKYGDKAASVQTIMAATGQSVEEVEAQMRKLMWFTDETSYSFTDMSANIGKFTNAGVDLETATTAMMGISNWAAISGANVNEASRAMYNLSQALATGSVKLIDWKSVENANMATVQFKQTAIDTAVELGELVEVGDGLYETLDGYSVSAYNFNEQLQRGWFSSDVLLKTLNRYGEYTEEVYKNRKEGELAADTMERLGDMNMELGAAAFRAAQEYRTAGDVINATSDAVSTKWMGLFQLFFGNAIEAKAVWAELGGAMYDIFAAPLDSLTSLIEPAMLDPADQLRQKLTELGVDYDSFYKNLIKVGKERGVWQAYENYGGGADAFGARAWATRIDIVRALNKEIGATNVSIEEVDSSLDQYSQLADEIILGKWGNGADRFNALTEAGFDYAQAQDLVNKRLAGEELVLNDLTDQQLETLGYTEDQIAQIRAFSKEFLELDNAMGKAFDRVDKQSGQELFFQSLKNLIEAGYTLFGAIGEAWHDIFPATTSEQIYKIVESIEAFTRKLILSEDAVEKVKQHFRGLFAAIDIVWQVIKAVGGGLKDIFKAILPSNSTTNKLFEFTGNIADTLVNLDKSLKESGAIKKAIGSVVDVAVVGIKSVKNFFADIPRVVSGFVDSVKAKHPDWASAWDDFKGKVKDFVGDFGANLKKAFGKLKDWIADIKKSDTGSHLYENLSKIGGKVGEFFSSFWENVKSGWDKVKPKLEELFSGIGDGFSGFIETVKNIFGEGDLGSIGQLLQGIFAGGIFFKLKKSFGSFDDIVENFSKASGKLKKVIKAYAHEINAKALKQVAIALGILAGSLWVISRIPADDLETAIDAMQKLMVGIGILSLVMSKFSVSTSSFSFSKEKGGGIFGAIGQIFGQGDTAKQLVKMAAAVLILSKAISILAQIDDQGAMWSGVGAVVVLMGALATFSRILPSDKRVAKLGATFKGLGLSVLLLAGAFMLFQKIDSKGLKKGLIGLGGAVAMLVGIMVTMKATGLTGSGMDAIGDTFRNLGIAMLLLSVAMKVFDTVSWTGVAIGLTALAGSLTLLVIAGLAVQKLHLEKSLMSLGLAALQIGAGMALAGIGLVAFSAGLVALAAAAPIAAGAAYVLVEVLGVLLDGIIAWVEENAHSLADAFILLVYEVSRALADSAEAISIELVDAIVNILAYVSENFSPITDALVDMLIKLLDSVAQRIDEIIEPVMVILGSIFEHIGKAMESDFGSNHWGIELFIWSLVPLIKVMAKLKKDIKDAFATAIVMGLVIGEMAGILYLIKDVDGTNALAQMVAIDGLIAGAAGIILALKDIDTSQAMNALADLDLFLADLFFIFGASGVLTVGLDELVKAFGGEEGATETVLDAGINTIAKLAEGLGKIVGSLFGGFNAGLIEPFLEAISKFDDSTIAGATAMATVLADLAEAAVLDTVAGFLGSDFDGEKMGKQLAAFGEAMVEFAASTEGLDPTQVEPAAAAGKILAELADSLPKTGGLVQDILGEVPDMSKFGKKLVKFGEKMVEFAAATEGLAPEDVEEAATAGKMLGEMADALPKTGGWYQAALGEIPDMDQFGTDLVNFAEAMVDFGEKAQNIKTFSISRATKAFKEMALAEDMVDMTASGNWGMLSASGVLDTFGTSYLNFYNTVASFDFTKLESAASNLQSLVDITTSDSNTKNIKDLSTALDNLSGFSVDGMVESFEGAADKMYVAGKDAIDAFLEGVQDGGDTGNAGLSSVTTAVEFVNSLQEQIDTYLDGFEDQGKSLLTSFNSGLTKGKITTKLIIKGLFRNSQGDSVGILDTIESYYETFKTKGTDVIQNFQTGVAEQGLVAIDVFKTLVTSCASALTNQDSYNSYYGAGQYVIKGFCDGIAADLFKVTQAGKDIGNKALNAAKEALDEHSPSKKFEEIGRFVVEGFANGIGMEQSLIDKALTKTFGKRLQRIAESMVDNFGASSEEVSKKLQKAFTDMYKETDAYKESKKQIKEYRKEIEKLEEEKANTTDSDKIKQITEQIEELNKSIIEEEKQMVKDMQDVFNEFYGSIKDTVKEYLDIYNLEIESTIDLFADLEDASDSNIQTALDILNAQSQVQESAEGVNTSISILNSTIKDSGTAASKSTKELHKYTDILSSVAETTEKAEKANKHADILNTTSTAVEEATSSIANSMNILQVNVNSTIDTFAAYTKQDRLGTTTIINRMKSQIDGVKGWMSKLDELSSKGISDAMLTKLKEMGPQGENYVDAFLRMTSEEITRANDLLAKQTKVSMSLYLQDMVDNLESNKQWANNLETLVKRGLSDGLLQELADMGPEGAEKVAAFVQMTDEQLQKLNKVYEREQKAVASVTQKISDLTSKNDTGITPATGLLDAMENDLKSVKSWAKNMKTLAERGLNEGLLQELADLGPSGAEKVATFVDMTKAEFKRLNSLYSRSIKASNLAEDILSSILPKQDETAELIDAMFGDIADVDKWSKNLAKLAEKGLNEGLLKELADLGPSGAEKVKQFVSMTKEELGKVNEAYIKSLDISKVAEKRVSKLIKGYVDRVAEEEAAAQREAEKKQMLKSMSDQIKSVKDWADNLKKLSKRGLEDGLLKQLADLGPSGSDQVALFVEMTDEEFTKLNKLFRRSDSAAKSVTETIENLTHAYDKEQAKKNMIDGMKAQIKAVEDYNKDIKKLRKIGLSEGMLKEVEALGIEGASQVKTFLSMSADEITRVNRIYKQKVELSNQDIIKSMKARLNDVKAWATNITSLQKRGVSQGLLKQFIEKGPESMDYVNALLSMSNDELKSFNKLYKQVGKVSTEVTDSVIGSYVIAGKDSASGFAQGLEEGQQEVDNAAANMAAQSLNAIRDTLGINSPSKEFAKLGDYAGLGFIESLRVFSEEAYKTSSEIGEEAKLGLSNAIALVFDILDAGLDMTPVITPVINLDEVNRGISLVNSGFASVGGLDMTIDSLNARSIAGRLDSARDSKISTDGGTGDTNYTFNQYNTSPKALSRLDIYRQTKNQFAQLKGVRR